MASLPIFTVASSQSLVASNSCVSFFIIYSCNFSRDFINVENSETALFSFAFIFSLASCWVRKCSFSSLLRRRSNSLQKSLDPVFPMMSLFMSLKIWSIVLCWSDWSCNSAIFSMSIVFPWSNWSSLILLLLTNLVRSSNFWLSMKTSSLTSSFCLSSYSCWWVCTSTWLKI